MPTAITLDRPRTAHAPRRSSLVTLMFCGFTIGSALGGYRAAQVVATTAGGRCSSAAASRRSPSRRCLAGAAGVGALPGRDGRRGVACGRPAADRAGAKLDGATFVGGMRRASPVRELFAGGLLAGTLLALARVLHEPARRLSASSWMPTLIQRSGLSLRGASLITAMFQVGGTVGAVALGRLMDRVNPHHVLGVAYLGAGGFVERDGAAAATPWLMASGGVRRGLLRVGRAGRRECAHGGVLSHGVPRHRRQLGAWRRPERIDSRLAGRRRDARAGLGTADGLRPCRNPSCDFRGCDPNTRSPAVRRPDHTHV